VNCHDEKFIRPNISYFSSNVSGHELGMLGCYLDITS
jgi:hypothetical protein